MIGSKSDYLKYLLSLKYLILQIKAINIPLEYFNKFNFLKVIIKLPEKHYFSDYLQNRITDPYFQLLKNIIFPEMELNAKMLWNHYTHWLLYFHLISTLKMILIFVQSNFLFSLGSAIILLSVKFCWYREKVKSFFHFPFFSLFHHRKLFSKINLFY